MSDEEKVRRMFGVRTEGGLVDDTYGDHVAAIASLTDNLIYFGIMLCEDLHRYGRIRRDEFVKRFGEDVPNIAKVNWSEARAKGLVPTDAGFETWKTGFRSRPKPTKGRWIAKLRYVLKKWWAGR